MYLMLQKETPDDFVIATGESRRLADFAAVAFAQVGLDPKDHLIIDEGLLRPTDIMTGQGNAEKAASKLGCQPRFKMEDVARMMVEACQAESEEVSVSVPVSGWTTKRDEHDWGRLARPEGAMGLSTGFQT
jgi:GDP-D-mannose dehydratase